METENENHDHAEQVHALLLDMSSEGWVLCAPETEVKAPESGARDHTH